MIDCVTIPTSHHFTGNLVREQHRLRYAECIVREGWRDLCALDFGGTPEWLGPEIGLVRSRYTVRAARVPVSQSIHERLQEFTRLLEPTVLNFGGEVLSDGVVRIT